MVIQYREMKPVEFSLLPEFLYYAIYVPEGAPSPDRLILQTPQLQKYYTDFGRHGDSALLALDGERAVGAIWGRVWHGAERGYGYVNNKYTEISLAVSPSYRGRGIGRQLLEHYLKWAKQAGLPGLSLSVSKDNFALHLYEQAGFQLVREGETDYVMSLIFS